MTPQDRNNQPLPGNQPDAQPKPYPPNQPFYGQTQAPRPAQSYQYQAPTQTPAQPPQYAYQPQPGPGKPPKKPKNPLLLWGGVVGGLVVLVVVTVLVIIPLFNRSSRTEADPFAAASGNSAAVATATPGATSVISTTTAATTVASTTAATKTATVPTAGTGVVSDGGTSAGTNASTNAGAGAAVSTAAAIATTAPARATSGAQILAKGEFTKIDAIHYARGTATIGVTGDGKKVLRFDNFTSNQGPDLKVYLGVRADGSKVKEGGLNLGALPATDGSYNIDLPSDADLSKYKSVVIWCEAFSVTFSVASLA